MGGLGAESYAREKAWSSINHSILFDTEYVHTVHKLSILHRTKAHTQLSWKKVSKRKAHLYSVTK